MTPVAEKNSGAALAKVTAPTEERSLMAEASSAHSRVNISLNLDNWKELPQEIGDELLWFHQWVLDNNVGWKEAEEAIGYDRSTIFRILKGTYEGSWHKIAGAIRSFRELEEKRRSIKSHFFVPNSISAIVFAALDYALANNSFT